MISVPKVVCFLTQSVQLTLSSVQLTLLECVMWSSKMSWNRGKTEQICTVKFQNFLGTMPPDLHTGKGLRRPSPNPTPSAHRPSLCVVDILRCFRPWVIWFQIWIEALFSSTDAEQRSEFFPTLWGVWFLVVFCKRPKDPRVVKNRTSAP